MVESLEAARRAAEAANRAKNAFLANMSHEIRTPMNGVLGALQLLKESRMEGAQEDLVATACGSAESLLHLLDDILDVSKIEAGALSLQRVPLHVPALIHELAVSLSPQPSERGLAFEIEIDPALDAPLDGDPARIRQILANLLSNAVKFTERGGITLTASVAARTGDGFRVRFQVADTGIGIPAADLPGLFQRFSQADPSLTRKYGGTGLGLAIVRQLAELMGGACGLESDPGRGSRAWCEIPLPSAEWVTGTGVEAPPAPWKDRLAGEVLLAEDNLVNRKIATSMLRNLGLAVTVAGDGREALELLGRQRFAAILMDCQMPVLDGYAATAAWREREAREGLPRTPVIAMTAHAMEGDREKCLAAGMDDYLPKPVRLATLAEMLQTWLPPARQPGTGS
jgi:hypothetical protein